MTLSELVKLPRWPHDGPITQWNRGEGLAELCIDALPKRWKLDQYLVADVGAANGVSARIFQQFSKVVSVDIEFWPGVRETLDAIPDITTWQGDSLDAARHFYSECVLFDGVYLDSRHEQEWLEAEIKAWLPCIKKGGFIAGHDFNMDFTGVQMAVNKMLGGPDHVYSDSSWIKRLP